MKRFKNILTHIGAYLIISGLQFGFSPACHGQGTVPDAIEYEALKALYDSLDGPNWINNTNWLQGNTSADFNTWHGVTVVNGDVTVINLPSNNLSGSIPSALGNLAELIDLSLHTNQIMGSIPTELERLVKLSSIYLYSNQLSGSIPQSLGNLADLRILALHFNSLNGNIPSSIGNLISLRNLYLYNNQLTGTIPSTLGNLTNLLNLIVSSNQLSGNIPPSLGNLTNLITLNLHTNQLTGSIPPEIGNLGSLTILSLHGNNLSGVIPSTFGNLADLLHLYLHNNQLTGGIPSALGNLTGLKSFVVETNQLSGSIPSTLGNLSNLNTLNLGDNQLTGGIPGELGNLNSLVSLILVNNNFTSFPNFTDNTNVSNLTVNIQNNKIGFASIEPNFTDVDQPIFKSLTYTPQNAIDTTQIISFQVGSPVTLPFQSTAIHNQHQWQKLNGTVWEDVVGATANTYTLPNPTIADSGTQYRCKITNAWVTGLTLLTREYTLEEVQPVSIPQQALNYIIASSVIKEGIKDDQVMDNFAVKDINKSVEYFDGLGRPIQSVIVQGSPDKNDVVQHRQYDQFGREINDYLPYASYMLGGDSKNDGSYKLEPLNNLVVFYSPANGLPVVEDIAKDIYFLAQKKIEPSPLNRITEQGAFGEPWQPNPGDENGKTIKFRYGANDGSQIRYWFIGNGFPQTNNYYSAGQLTLNVVKDEEGNETREYTDKLGRMVLKEVQNVIGTTQVEWLQTYYVYDDFNNLRYVFPPKAVEELKKDEYSLANFFDPILQNLSFQYAYDERQRMIMKKVPGAEPVYMVYDQFDRLVFTQDGNQFEREEWSFTKYDHLNRPIITGTTTIPKSPQADRMGYRDDVERDVDDYYNEFLPFNENYRYESFSAIGGWGYTDRSFPETAPSSIEVLTVTYYDNYDFVTPGVLGGQPGDYDFEPELDLTQQDTLSRLKGLVTGSRTRVFGPNNIDLNTVTYYDDRYRVVQAITDTFTGGFDRITTAYDFAGRVLQTKQTHRRGTGSFDDLVVNQSFTYDHASRLLNTYHRINNQDPVLLTANAYNEIGELVEKNLHSTNEAGSLFEQSVDYRYNIRGWLTQINERNLSPPDPNTLKPDYFSMQLYYNEKVEGLNYEMTGTGQDPLNKPSPYFQQMLHGIPVKPLISYKRPGFFTPPPFQAPALFNTRKANWGNKSGVDYRTVTPKAVKAKTDSDKQPGIGFYSPKQLPDKETYKTNSPQRSATGTSEIAFNGKDNPVVCKNEEWTKHITPEVFLNVGLATLTAAADGAIWVTEDFTMDKVNGKKPERGASMFTQELWLEVECGTVGANWTTTFDAAASGNNYVVMASGTGQTASAPTSVDDHLSYTFDITTAGNYKVWARVFANNSGNDSFWVRMDGGAWTKWNNIPVGSWLWDDVHDSDNAGAAVTFNLAVGSHTLDIAFREIGAKIDKLYISGTGATPSGTGQSATNCVATAPPSDPTGLAAERASFNYVKLVWDANAQIVDDYTIERSLDNVNFTAIGTTAGYELSYQDNTAQMATGYYYRIRANNTLGSSNFSPSVNAVTLASPGVVTDQLLLYLDARNTTSYPGSGNTWYDLAPNTNDATLGGHSFDGTDLGFSYNGTQVITSDTLPIAQNQAFSVGFWINPSDNSRPTEVKSSNNTGAFFFNVASGYSGSVETGIDNAGTNTMIARTNLPSGLLANNQDQYFVYTYSSNIASLYKNGELLVSKDIGPMTADWARFKLSYSLGKFNAAQIYGKVLTPDEVRHNYMIGYGHGNTVVTIPDAPTGLVANVLSVSQIALSWNDVAVNEIYYLVERSIDGVNFTAVKYLAAGTTAYEDQNLEAATGYTYRVSAVNSAGSSNPSAPQAATTDNLPAINIVSDALELYLDAGNASSYNGAGTGTALNDISGKNNHAVLDGGVSAISGHLHFTDQGFSAPLPALTAGATNFSIGFWMKPDAAAYRNNSVQATSSEFGYGSFFSRNDAVNNRYITGVTSTNMYDSYSVYVLNEWAYFVFTYDNGTARMYKNGVEFGNSPKAQDPVSLDFEGIALKQGYGDFDVLQAYSKTLTGQEVFQNYEIHKNRYFVPTEAPPAPTGLAVNLTTPDEIKITWTDNADNEDKFVVEVATNENGPFNLLDEVIVNVNNYSHQGLGANQALFYRVKAENAIGSSAYSNVIGAKTLSAATSPPAAPAGLSARVQSYNRIRLDWNDVATQEDEYQVERSTDGTNYSLLVTLPFNSVGFDDTGLAPSTTYHYRVKALNSSGSSAFSNVVDGTTTSLPDFSVVTSGIRLYLDATLTMSYDGAGPSWYDLSGNGNDAVLDAGVAKENGRLHFTGQGFEAPLPGMLAGTTNFSVGFWVRPDAQGNAYNNVSSVNAENLVGAYYAMNEGGTRMVTGVLNNRFGPYNIYELNTWVYMVYTYDNGTGRLYKNGTLINGPTAQGPVEVDFEAMAFSQGHGDFEVLQVYDKTLNDAEVLQNYNADKDRYRSTAAIPGAPTGLAASVVSKSQINLTWTDNATDEGNYIVEYSTDGGTSYQVLVGLPSAAIAYEHAGLPPGQTVYYRVAATNSTGVSAYSNVTSAATLLEDPAGLTAIPYLSYQIDLSWVDNAQNEAGYEIERKPSAGGTYALIHTTAANVGSYADVGLAPETGYTYRVRAMNGTNYSVYSNEVTAATGPNPPTGLSVSAVSAFEIDVSWVDNTAIGTGYVLERSLSSSSGFVEVASLGANTTTHRDGGLLSETTYFYRVKATSANGSSAYSNVAGASTLPLISNNPNLEYKSTIYHNGNISAVTWQTYNSGQEQGYTYIYDEANRITSASHVYATGPTSWNMNDAGFSVGNITYDHNGNIKSLKRHARNLGGVYVMDDLGYFYEDSEVSNRLKSVSDGLGNEEGFKDGNTTATDYAYDANGNLVRDLNKGIDTIQYNLLNLPEIILFANGNQIYYTYDAAGTKLRKEVREDVGGVMVSTVTDYMSGVQYTINDFKDEDEGMITRDFVQTAEGRVVVDDPTPIDLGIGGVAVAEEFVYEYNLTDHLGNVRVTFTTKDEVPDEYLATFETAAQANEALDFQNYGDAVIIPSIDYNHTDSIGADKSVRLSGGAGEVIGLAKSLAVVPGDVIDMEVYVKYLAGTGGTGIGGILGIIAEAFGVSGTSTGEGLQAYNAISGLMAIPDYVTLANNKTAETHQVFLNYLLFDVDFNLVDADYEKMDGTANAVPDPAAVAHEHMSKSVIVTKPGYIYIYLSNESGQIVETFFDDFKITHTKSPIISADDYYPFGLQIAQNAYQRESAVDQRYKYNGKELQPELGLNWYDYGARMYDASIGRFMVTDRFSEKYFDFSPYQYAINNPVRLVDINGDSIWINYGDNQRVLYQNGELLSQNSDGFSSYSGDDEFVNAVFETLNTIGSLEIGEEVLNTLSSSESSFSFVNKASSAGDKSLSFKANEDNQGGTFQTAALLNPEILDGQKIEGTAHELFHGFQQEKGQLTSENGINSEVGAYLFARGVSFSLGFPSAQFGSNTAAGRIFDTAMSNLLFGDQFDLRSYQDAVKNFKAGSSANAAANGIYNRRKVNTGLKNPVIKNLYPLIR